MNNFSTKKVNKPILIFVCLFFVTSLQAQEKKNDSHQLEAITVTAQKQEENVQDVPINMSVLTDWILRILISRISKR